MVVDHLTRPLSALALAALAQCADPVQPPGALQGDTEFLDATPTHMPAGVLGGRDMDARPGDIDGDGDLDLVVAVEFGRNIVLVNDGTGRFAAAPARLQGPVRDSEDIALTDLDGDGDLDLVFVTEDDVIDELYLNDGGGLFTDASDRLPTNATSNAVLAADLSGDGAPDLLIGNAGPNFFFLNDGTGRFTDASAARYPAATRITQDLELGDIDGDGDLDLIEGNEDGNRVLINTGGGVFEDETADRFPARTGEETREADLGDVDGDGDLDLVLANVQFGAASDGVNRVLLNDGTGVFAPSPTATIEGPAISTVDVDLFDVDGDGRLDLFEGNFGGRGYRVLLNDGAGGFTDATSDYLPAETTGVGVDIELFDADGDGDADLFLTHYQGRDHFLLRR